MQNIVHNVFAHSLLKFSGGIARIWQALGHSFSALYLGVCDGLGLWSKFGALADDDRAKARLACRKPDADEN